MRHILTGLLIIAIALSSCTTGCNKRVPGYSSPSAISAVELHDYMIYLTTGHENSRQLIMFDPDRQTHTALLPDWVIDNFSISANNRLAFSTKFEENKGIFTSDYPFIKGAPVKVDEVSFTEYYPLFLLWSHQGQYLAFDTAPQSNGETLYVWDGKVTTPINQNGKSVGDLDWSLDGKLAFKETYLSGLPTAGDTSEVFVWDGRTTINISQNPSGEDLSPAWSADGQLAFLSERNDEYDIYVWDGKSTIDGAPDTHAFINISPELTGYYSFPVWTSSGSLSFIAFEPNDRSAAQIFEWDGHTATNISQNPGFHNGSQTWRPDGYWSFVTFFSSGQLLYVRNAENQPVLTNEGQYSPAWSQQGRLMFCLYERPDWVLSMWDGKNVTEVVRGYEIRAQWNNGEYVFCSSG